MRGTPHQVDTADFPHIKEVFDYQPTYRGRRRYRGMIKNLQFDIREGVPNIWNYSFTFEVFKNETTFRRSESNAVAPNVSKTSQTAPKTL